jgi:YkoY family integral membrane protein
MEQLIQTCQVLIQQFSDNLGQSMMAIGLLIIIESLLSVDNAAVLATMVKDLPEEQRDKALKYGIWGAYFFRGLALIFAAFIIEIWWLKPVGGLYLLYLVYDYWKGKQTEETDDDILDKNSNWLYRVTVGSLGTFWATVALVELMDMTFSIDNVLAAVAYVEKFPDPLKYFLVCTGVFIGILAMRFVAQWFVKLMSKYAFLETSAFIVIGVLGIKLLLSSYTHFYPCSEISIFIEGSLECNKANNIPNPPTHEISNGDIITSILTLSIFFVPILTSILFNYPKRSVVEAE